MMNGDHSRNTNFRRPLGVAVIGMGGFAASHHEALYELERVGRCRVVATCDSNPEKLAASPLHFDFTNRGIRVYSDYLEMLDACRDQIDFVTVPTPIPLHAPMHRACVERGLACYLEKPPTLFWKEMEEMLRVEQQAFRLTQAGFAHIVEGPRQALKGRLLRGEFGSLRRVGFSGQWPRDSAYYRRTPWAGRLQLDGQLILDSCIGNAMSHYIHNVLYWCGQDGLMSWGEVESVQAELYRAHRIDNFDTCFARGLCRNGIEICIAATHTGFGESRHVEWLECEAATIRYQTGLTIRYDIHWHDGRTECDTLEPEYSLKANFCAYIDYLQGETPRPPTTLTDCRPFVYLSNLLYVAAGDIHSIGDEYVTHSPNPLNGSDWVEVEGMEQAVTEFKAIGLLPGEGGARWGAPGGRAESSQITHTDEAISQMLIGTL